ncbi:MAG: AAA family ATPase [Theionarchaea archaeon]|nr:AAA family ATPase [Theionarchaea archaeon]MBU7019779.1 AAA family ATPase [Theionarchaea archaeon]MBU7034601.1 AAA family ATPase [Theionarchaea archaeon]MBU7041309.1 AAA family ATPase [Theionarchaea archaeon]
MKIAIAGKGGVGKTTLAALLSTLYRDEGRTVLAIDADSNPNLATILGITTHIVPLTDQKELVEERTQSNLGGFGGVFKLNPRVDDIASKFAVEHEGIKVLVMGSVKMAESGCACPANVLVKNLLSHILLTEKDVVICDMEAGVEHLGRGTAKAVDAMVVVVEPGRRSVETANRIYHLAQEMGICNIFAVGNKVRSKEERDFLEGMLEIEVLGNITYDEKIIEADMKGELPQADQLVSEVKVIKENLESLTKSNLQSE